VIGQTQVVVAAKACQLSAIDLYLTALGGRQSTAASVQVLLLASLQARSQRLV
jgi:hypothetical protein